MRRWLVLAAGLAALAMVSSAEAVVYAGDGGAAGTATSQPVGTTGGGFDWADAAVGLGVGLGIALCALMAVRLTRNRRRLAILH